jgi:hypothetical protein
MLVKVSILMLYHRMARGRPFFRYATLMVGTIVLINGTVLMLLNIFQCRPVAAAFNDQDFDQVHCIDIIALFLCSSPVTVITDIAILIIPLPMVTSMRLDIRQKVGLVATFITGLFVTIVDVIRIAYLQEALIQVQNPMAAISSGGLGHVTGSIPNFAWHASYCLMWSAIEVNVGLTCACALVIKPLLVRIIPWGSHNPSSASCSPGGSVIRGMMSHASPDHGTLEETAVFPGDLGEQCPAESEGAVRIDQTFPTRKFRGNRSAESLRRMTLPCVIGDIRRRVAGPPSRGRCSISSGGRARRRSHRPLRSLPRSWTLSTSAIESLSRD